jgi:DNA replication protein DnaC
MEKVNSQQDLQAADRTSLVSETLAELKIQCEEAEKKARLRRFKLPYSAEDFKILMTEFGNIILLERASLSPSQSPEIFIIDDQDKYLLNQLFFYARHDDRFEGDLSKGIMVIGPVGTGKSVIMEAYQRLLNNFSKKFTNLPIFKWYKSYELFDKIKLDGMIDLKCPVFIDELGREKKSGKDYGNDIQPVIEWLMQRYDLGTLTHGTSNYLLEDLCKPDMYGEMLGDRLKSMFNFLVLNGKSRRK